MKTSKTMLRVLRRLLKGGPYSADELSCSISTLIALEKRGLVHVEMTFNSIAFPRRALVWITDTGEQVAR